MEFLEQITADHSRTHLFIKHDIVLWWRNYEPLQIAIIILLL